MNQSYNEKKRGFPNRSDTAPSATGIAPRFPPLKTLVRRLLALSSRVLFALERSELVDWHLQQNLNPLQVEPKDPNTIYIPSSTCNLLQIFWYGDDKKQYNQAKIAASKLNKHSFLSTSYKHRKYLFQIQPKLNQTLLIHNCPEQLWTPRGRKKFLNQ